MNRREATVAFWSTAAITFFTALFLISIFIFPLRPYHDLLQYTDGYGFKAVIPAIPSFFVALSHFPFLAGLYLFAREDKKVFAIVGLLFGGAYALLACVNYFSQLTFVFQSIVSRRTIALDLFVLDNPYSFIFSVEVLAYTFLFLACLFWAQLFLVGVLDRWIRVLLYICGAVGMVGAAGHVAGSESVAIALTLAAAPYAAAMALMAVRFSRLRQEIAA